MSKQYLWSMSVIFSLIFTAAASAHETQPRSNEDIVKLNFAHRLPGIPGKSLKAVEVIYPPGAASPSHRHASSAFIYAYVVAGEIVSQAAGQPERTWRAGESWYEEPGAHHLVSRNASKDVPAKLLAVFVVDSHDTELTIADQQK
ncbi:cupin domain-containing protein [Mixta tenebrionis]|uniref:Cupin domain-containing protein n=1 Tax=Mixta tenebrionis TaxID=2562439 RepID=A0A506VCL3_9GAMM|nr:MULTISPECIES: cupin domain-containing protein [Mixta]QHM75396.1 hypothetical protein C7M52_01349 [Mixta theicola]TPW43288.1 cupin domain-containing protein [Mixta tenebrionis]